MTAIVQLIVLFKFHVPGMLPGIHFARVRLVRVTLHEMFLLHLLP